MIIGKQPLAGTHMLHNLCRRAKSPNYLSAQPAARQDVVSVAGRPMDLVSEGTHLAAYVVAGSALPVRPYKLHTEDDIDAILTNLGCTRLTREYRVELSDHSFVRAGANYASGFKRFQLLKSEDVPHWSHDDRMVSEQGFNPKDGDVFMLMLIQETFSELMTENVAFILPFATATLVTKGSEFVFDSDPLDTTGKPNFGVSYGGISVSHEELRSMAFKGAN